MQELRGNIRVFCRCRPPSEREIANEDGSAIVVTFPNEGEVRPYKTDSYFDPTACKAATMPFGGSGGIGGHHGLGERVIPF